MIKEYIFSVLLFSSYAYLLLFVLLALTGAGLPLPDELLILLGGYLCKKGTILVIPTLFFLYIGVLLGDIIPYLLGMSFGDKTYELAFVKRYFSDRRIRRLDAMLRLYGKKTSIFVRFFMFGIRPLAYAFLGTRKFSLFPYEYIGVALNVALWFLAGSFFSAHIEVLLKIIYRLRTFVALGLLFLLSLYLIEKYIVKKKRLRFFSRLEISFITSGTIVLLVFAFENVKARYFDFNRTNKFFSYYSEGEMNFLFAGKKAKIINALKKEKWKYVKGRKGFVLTKDGQKLSIFSTKFYLDGKPLWIGVGEIQDLKNVKVIKLRTEDEKDIPVFIFPEIPFKKEGVRS